MTNATLSSHSSHLRQLLDQNSHIRRNLTVDELINLATQQGEGQLTEDGALVVSTGAHTGRSPKDRYLVKDEETSGTVDWGAVNQPLSPEQYDLLEQRFLSYFKGRAAFVQDLSASSDPQTRLHVQVVTAQPWHSLFAKQMFLPAPEDQRDSGLGDFLVLQAPEVQAVPAEDGTRSSTFIVVNFSRRTVLIGGTAYAGEIKKSIFSVMNYLLPDTGVFPMHCSANIGAEGDVALFFGLSGTGKTTLSADPERSLIGDDEHGWSGNGIFNIEGGCYAKVIRLSRDHEPQIWKAIHQRGAVLENVTYDDSTKALDFDDDSVTENTRAAYDIRAIDNAVIPGVAGHPRHILFLTCDAFGVLPPIARLDPAQTMYHFLSGYTAKVAGTEAGITEPQVTFSSCFGAPFLPRKPKEYAAMLGDKMRKHQVFCWLVNTGWTGGQFGEGHRMPLPATRALVKAALSGSLNNASFQQHPIFRVQVPNACPGVDPKLLDPRSTWSHPERYDEVARDLAGRFRKNFEKFDAPEEVRNTGPAA